MYYYDDFGNGFGNSYGYGYGNDYGYGVSGIDLSALRNLIGGIIAIYLIILIVSLIFALAEYILKGIGMYTIARRENRDYPWLAFVPFARIYLQGELGGDITLKKKKIKNPGIWLIVMPFIAAAAGLVLYVLFSVVGLGMIFSVSYYGISAGTVTVMVILAVISLILMLVYSAVYKVLRVLINKQIYAKFTSDSMSVAHAVLGVFLPFYEAICFFVMRNKKYNPGREPIAAQPFMTSPPPSPVSPASTGRPVMPPAQVPPEPELGPKTEELKPEPAKRPSGPIAGDGFVMSDDLQKKADDPRIKPLHETENRPYSYGEPVQDTPSADEKAEEVQEPGEV